MSRRPPIVLASTSPYRRELLERLKLPFAADAPDYDEPALDLPHDTLVATHARNKAKSLATRHPDALIIGSDQLVSFDGEVLGKPKTVAGAIAQLTRMAGREHRLLTAVAVLDANSGRLEEALDVHVMRLRPLSQPAIAAYVAHDMPLNCAGSYKLESLGISLFESISGSDDTAVVGLPLLSLVRLLGRFGIDPLLASD